jgi:formylglycine-generating enzyme required for sulfatase activity
MKRRFTPVLIGLLALSLLSCTLVNRCTRKAKEVAEDAVTAVVATVSSPPTAASQPTATLQPDAPPPDAPPPELAENQIVRPKDGAVMVPIPAGEFIMGAEKAPSLPNERPQRTVTLDAYYVDQFEITNAQYKLCVAAGACGEPSSLSSADYRDGYAGDDHPVVGVTWEHARAYCEWAEVRLPTEAEWEKAARGTDGRPYPWGSDRPDGSQANMSGDEDPYEYTAPVGSFAAGASPYGLMDMTGNAREWVADWYQKDYYANAPSRNPPGPESGEMDMRVSRGGSFAESAHHSRTSDRMPQKADLQPKSSPFLLGFRCAVDDELSGLISGSGPRPPGPTATTAAQAPDDGSPGPVDMVELGNLQTYRAEWVTRITYPGQDGGTMLLSYTLEWTKDPLAQRVIMDKETSPFAEVVWFEGETWIKVDGTWVKDDTEEAVKPFKNFHDAFQVDDEMTFVETQMVNGFRADRYVYDFVSPDGAHEIHREIWVANQPDLPRIGVRATFVMKTKSSQGTSVAETEANLLEANTEFEIKRP